MVILMEMNSGKMLDEACNHYNDVYSDEVLYAAWAGVPRTEARLQLVSPSPVEPASVDVEGFMARLYACQR